MYTHASSIVGVKTAFKYFLTAFYFHRRRGLCLHFSLLEFCSVVGSRPKPKPVTELLPNNCCPSSF